MNSVNNMLKNVKNHDIILGVIIVIYILGGYQTPHEIAPYINNLVSYVIMIILFLMAIMNTNIVVAVLLGAAFFVLVQRTHSTHPTNVMPSQSYRDTVMNNLNVNNTFNSNSQENKQELEEIMVNNISTINFKTENLEEPTFKPIVSNSQNVFELQ